MQRSKSGNPPRVVTTAGAWEMVVRNGSCDGVVSVGDAGPDLNSSHRIKIEGQTATAGLVPTSTNHFRSGC
ncbi:MAG: hypothetical protein M3N47_07855 [Chloroflexota bacterium]|nr:hypothetical protein [Chloroflexota bacterium]